MRTKPGKFGDIISVTNNYWQTFTMLFEETNNKINLWKTESLIEDTILSNTSGMQEKKTKMMTIKKREDTF